MNELGTTARSIVAYKGYMSFLLGLTDTLNEPRDEGELTGLLVVQLSNLNKINTAIGYEAGHRACVDFAEQIEKLLRSEDWMAALAKDRFAVVLGRIRNVGHLVLAANRIVRLAEAISISDGTNHQLDARVGASMFPDHGDSPEQLLCNAELALEMAAHNKSTFAVYQECKSQKFAEDWEIEAQIGVGIEDNEFKLFYQPKVDARTLLPCGAEGLMRWHSRSLGDVSTARFIQIVEQTDHIDAFTNLALHCAARDASEWPDYASHLSVAVNLPPKVIEHGNIVASFQQVAAIWGVAIERFTAEVTENGIMETGGAALEVLQQLRDIGVHVSIDDFGTGNSSLAYFKDIPADEVKIDKSFVYGMLEDESSFRLVKTIIDLAHGFGKNVVAEGVETAECVAKLQQLGCDALQGYYFSRPLPQQEFSRYLSAQNDRRESA